MHLSHQRLRLRKQTIQSAVNLNRRVLTTNRQQTFASVIHSAQAVNQEIKQPSIAFTVT
jgi:hypothetical protein